MNYPPKSTESYKHLHDIMNGQIKTQLLLTGLKLGIFNHLLEFTPPRTVAEKLGSHPENTRRFLNALTTIDLLDKKNGCYRNSRAATVYLSEKSPNYIGKLFMLIDRMCLDPLANVEKMVLEGPPPEIDDRDFSSEELWASHTSDSAAWVYGEAGETVSGIITSLPGADDFRHMLDLGGGHGMFAIYFASSLSSLNGVVYDRAPVAAVAQTFIEKYELQDRISIMNGNYLKDDIGSGYDLVWASATLNFAKNDLDPLVKKIHDSLNPGGYFVSFQDGLTNEMTKPETMLGHMIDTLRTGQDFSFEQGEIADSMVRCGFQTIRSRTLDTPMGMMDMDIARKSF